MIPTGSKGFTLVEALVTGVLVSILGLILITIVEVVARETADSGTMSRLQAEYCVVASQIGTAVRNAKYVLAGGETPDQPHPLPDTVNTICIVTASGTDTMRYRVDGGVLQDSTGAGWRNFIIGIDTIRVAGSGGFILAGGRKNVRMNLAIWMTDKKHNDTVAIDGELYQCRN